MAGLPSVGRSKWFTPFRLIVLGAALLLAAALTSAIVGLAIAFVFGTINGYPGMGFILAYEVFSAIAAAIAPVGSFLLLIGLARAVRPTPSTGTRPDRVPGVESRPPETPPPRPRYRITFFGAVVVLVAGLGQLVFFLTLLLMPANLAGTDIATYELVTRSLRFALAVLTATGGFVAFYGLALAVRDGWLRSASPAP